MINLMCPVCAKSNLLIAKYTTSMIAFDFYLCPSCGRAYDANNTHIKIRIMHIGNTKKSISILRAKKYTPYARKCFIEYPTKEFFNQYIGTRLELATWY